MLSNKIKNNAKLILSFDDYHPLNIKLGKLLKSRGLIATFYIETNNPAALTQIKKLHAMGHEIGGHTLSHPSDLKALPIMEAKAEMEACKQQIENITGEECYSFAYPRGRYNEDIIYLLKKIGYKDARTTKVLNYDNPIDYYQLETTLHIYDGRKEYNGKRWDEFVDEYLEAAIARQGVFSIWGHAWEMDRDDQWERFIKFLDKVQPLIIDEYKLI